MTDKEYSKEVQDWFDSGPVKPEILDTWLKIIQDNWLKIIQDTKNQ